MHKIIHHVQAQDVSYSGVWGHDHAPLCGLLACLLAVEVHAPRGCSLGYLKRAICRASQGMLYPSAQVT